jgi:SAM-dependent methyltransferase
MDEMQLLQDLHGAQERQGPGSEDATMRAIELALPDKRDGLKIADIGCGTGAAAVVLARELDARITAVDFLQGFLDILGERAQRLGLADRISCLKSSMDALPFSDCEFDLIWSEGAVYNMGFTAGVRAWRRFLKSGGILAVSELTWLTATRPPEIQAHWQGEYPEIDTASAKMRVLEECGYAPVGYFVLPRECWMENYYLPLRHNFAPFLERNPGSAARAIVKAEEREISLYERFGKYFSYGFYIARKEGE